MDIAEDETIRPADFPEPKLLVWNRDPLLPIHAEEILEIYERNWRFVDFDRLSQQEAALIERLKRRYGRGVPLTP